MKQSKYPCSGMLTNQNDKPVRLMKNPDPDGPGVGLVPNKTLCIVMGDVKIDETHTWYWVDLYGTYAYVPQHNIKIRKGG